MKKAKVKSIFVITIFLVGLFCGLFINQFLNKKNNVPQQSTVNEQTSIKSNTQSFDWLDIPVEYFSRKDVRWGSAGKGSSGNISDYSQVALLNKAVYQSYPTEVITIKDYSSEIKPLKTRSLDEVMQELSKSSPEEYSKTVVKENYQKYGSLATNYLPTDSIWTLEKFDVDDDGISETVVSYNFVGSADGGSYRSDIIKGNNMIFSVQEDNASIVPADTTSGFYVEWRGKNGNTGRCCPESFIRTRFVFKDGKFTPLHEQEVKYLKIGKERESTKITP